MINFLNTDTHINEQLNVQYLLKGTLKTVSQSFSTATSIVGRGEAGAYFQQSMGRRRGIPWTGHQSIAGQHRHTQVKQPCTHSVIPKGNVERPINLTVMFLDCGRKPEYPERTHAWGEHANSMQKDSAAT
ncbi:hypothetical protein CHARACLAT_014901 [Characodon lateralis]|uniref:Uncharacterized protein n=1 Tax=Characodon lateralis TaxID=208331 RepID=A0ABU7D8W5_9TELE|nr:hypothetical protein [Characodon lateralis]